MTSVVKGLANFVKATLIGGLLVVLPLALLGILLSQTLDAVQLVVNPIADQLPEAIRYPFWIALCFLIGLCFLVGLAARTAPGRAAGRLIERRLLARIPGYAMVRTLTRRIRGMEDADRYAPALVEIEGGLVPAFIIEEFADAATIFVPAAPTPGVGSIYILPRARVRINATFMETVKCISGWGAGAETLVATLQQADVASRLFRKTVE